MQLDSIPLTRSYICVPSFIFISYAYYSLYGLPLLYGPAEKYLVVKTSLSLGFGKLEKNLRTYICHWFSSF